MKLIQDTTITSQRIQITVNPLLKKYIKQDFYLSIENIDLTLVPEHILLTPFIFNIAPIVWLSGQNFTITKLNKETYESLTTLKAVFEKLYPKIEFNGQIKPECISNDPSQSTDAENRKGISLFSGGLDSLTTVYRHYEKLESIVVVKGADIKLDDHPGWRKVSTNSKEFAKIHNLKPYFVTTNLRDFLNNSYLDSVCMGAGWWAQIQHGMGLTSMMAIPAYLEQTYYCYIASSHTKEFSHNAWASMPIIDNSVKWGQFEVVHDAYELTRQEKTKFLVQTVNQVGTPTPNLRVCYLTEGGTNCCKCEKCARTITALLACNANPNEYGFDIQINEFIPFIKRKFKKIEYPFKENEIFHWYDIAQYIQPAQIQQASKLEADYLSWIKNYDFQAYSNEYFAKRARKEKNVLRKFKYKIKAMLAS